jgi:glycosyltransferase involved in cell wall biosynthesis
MSEDYAPVFQCLPETNSYWRLPDIDSLSECMRLAYENRDEAKEKGIEGSKFVRDFLTWDMCARNIKKIIKEVLVEKNISDNVSIQRRNTDAIVFA